MFSSNSSNIPSNGRSLALLNLGCTQVSLSWGTARSTSGTSLFFLLVCFTGKSADLVGFTSKFASTFTDITSEFANNHRIDMHVI